MHSVRLAPRKHSMDSAIGRPAVRHRLRLQCNVILPCMTDSVCKTMPRARPTSSIQEFRVQVEFPLAGRGQSFYNPPIGRAFHARCHTKTFGGGSVRWTLQCRSPPYVANEGQKREPLHCSIWIFAICTISFPTLVSCFSQRGLDPVRLAQA